MNNGAFNAGGEAYDRIFRALGDPHRMRIMELLRERELSAGEILDTIDIVQSTLSHHMKTLSDSGAVNAVRRGKWTYYSLNESNLASAAAYLASCAEGTRVRRTGAEAQNSAAQTVQRISKRPPEAAGRDPVKAAAKTAGRDPVKAAAKTADRDPVKAEAKASDKSGKKKDKKGKKSKKNKK